MIDQVRRTYSLNGTWRYHKDEKETGIDDKLYEASADIAAWPSMELPANWYRTEVGNYHGVIWFARDFEYRDEPEGREHRILFHGVDYIGDAWLNGKYLGRHEGYFAPFAFATLDALEKGANRLVVRVDSPYDDVEYRDIKEKPGSEWPVSKDYKPSWPIAHTLVKGSLLNFYHRPGHRTKFGQDGNTGGIWQDVELIDSAPIYIEQTKISPLLVRDALNDDRLDGTAILSLNLRIVNRTDEPRPLVLHVEARGYNFSGGEEVSRDKELVVQPGLNRVRLVHTIEEPRLWWCWDQGDPNLYQMILTLRDGSTDVDKTQERFGIREIRVDRKTGQWWLNGRRIFARGMRYYSSQWGSEVTEDLLKQDLSRMRELNINATRIGSHIEKMPFYRLCDELGIMVWQVMPFHWGNWSDSDDLIERSVPMMTELVNMLYNCPSLAVWSTYKEPLVFPFDNPPNLVGRLCETLKRTAMADDPMHWVHIGDYEEGVLNCMPGLCRDGMTDLQEVTLKPQIVEFGAGALPVKKTIDRVLDKKDQWPPNWDKWVYYNVDPAWFGLMRIDPESMSSIEELIEATQNWYARQVKESIEYFRQRKYKPVCSMFQYFWSDPWPCIYGSGLLDYYREEYKAYDSYRYAYTPVMASVEWIKDKHIIGFPKTYRSAEILEAQLWITNDLPQFFDKAALRWDLVNSAQEVIVSGEKSVDIVADSSEVAERFYRPLGDDPPGAYRLRLLLADRRGATLSENFFDYEVVGS